MQFWQPITGSGSILLLVVGKSRFGQDANWLDMWDSWGGEFRGFKTQFWKAAQLEATAKTPGLLVPAP
jgi:hypothetical protein